MARILVVAEKYIASLLRRKLHRQGHDVTEANGADEAKRILSCAATDVLIVYPKLAEGNRIELSEWIASRPELSSMRVIVVSARHDSANGGPSL